LGAKQKAAAMVFSAGSEWNIKPAGLASDRIHDNDSQRKAIGTHPSRHPGHAHQNSVGMGGCRHGRKQRGCRWHGGHLRSSNALPAVEGLYNCASPLHGRWLWWCPCCSIHHHRRPGWRGLRSCTVSQGARSQASSFRVEMNDRETLNRHWLRSWLPGPKQQLELDESPMMPARTPAKLNSRERIRLISKLGCDGQASSGTTNQATTTSSG